MVRLLVAILLGVAVLEVAAPLARAADGSLPWIKGVQLDVNIANLSGDYSGVASFEDRIAMGGGIFVIMPLNATFAIKTGLLYTPRGADSPNVGTPEQITGTVKLDYLEAPVLARFTLVQHGSVRPILLAGAELSVLTSSSLVLNRMGYPPAVLSLNAEDFDFGLCLGGGLEIGAGKGTILADARYTWGLTDVYNAVNISDDRNRTLTLSLGYGF